MGFWRREPLHERLAREGGLDRAPRVDTGPSWGEVGIHGVSRPREWDAVATVDAELEGNEARFVALPDGTLLVESGPDDLAPLAEAVERSLAPPYRAEAVRRSTETWAVAARTIRVVDLPDQDGEELDLTIGPDGRKLLVDGQPRFGSVPALEALVAGGGHVRGSRLDGTLWEVQATRL
jgi:hypothetical protein